MNTDDPATVQPNTDLTDTGGEPQSWTPDDIMTGIYLVLGSVGLLGNTFVIVVIFTHTAMKKQLTNLLIINQSLIDATSSLVVILNAILADRGRTLHGVAGILLCRFWYSMYLLWSPLTSSTFNLLAIAIERYLCIVHPIMYKNKVTRKNILTVCVITWSTGFIFEIFISILPAGLDENNRCNVHYFWPNVNVQQGVGVSTIVLCFILPLLAMIYCYGRIAMVLNSRILPTDGGGDAHEGGSGGGKNKVDQMSRARKNVLKTLIIVTVIVSICWTPNQTIFLYFNLGYHVSFTTWYYHLSIIMVYCNTCCNPFIYIGQYEQFQIGIKRLKNKIYQSKSSRGEMTTSTSVTGQVM